MRLGLFNQIYLRVVGLIVFVIAAMLVFNHFHEQRALLQAWQADLQQEAEWIAGHWSPDQSVPVFAHAWRQTHDGVRFQITDANGNLVADSEQAISPHTRPSIPEENALVGRAPFRSYFANGELILSRDELPFMGNPASLGLLLTGILLAMVAAGVMYPFVRSMTNSLSRLSSLASRVAEGHFGETLPEKGNRDIATLIASFNGMSSQLRAAEQQNERLLSDVSHELRSPLARLAALVDTIKRHPDEVEELSVQISREVDLMDRLIDDVLKSSRIEAPQTQLELEQLDANKWASDAAGQLRNHIEGVGCRFNAQVSALPANAAIDAQRLMQVLGNLTDNALTAMVNVTNPKIDLQTDCSGNDWVCRVTDNGKGIAAADLPFLFDRFYRVDHGRDRTKGGAGLGLSICQAIVEAHGGRISITSEITKGTCVEIRIPSQIIDPTSPNPTETTHMPNT